jgi:hypothetical protein
MPTVTEIRTQSPRPAPEARAVLAGGAIPRVLGGAGVTESERPEPPFWAGAIDAFGSGWPTLDEEVQRWS